ncbi:MAG: porin family protein [Candidatus Eisenbacteria bacterium]|nr:porin family protein [Candidatus Eisenbacteria bacterium]
MKKICLLLVPALVLAAPAFAQMEAGMSMMTVGVSAGYGLPMGDFADCYDGGFMVGLNGCYMFTDMYGMELGVDWVSFAACEDMAGDLDIKWQYIPITLDFLAKFPAGNFSPYVKGGVGYYLGSATGDDVPDDTENENDFGINVGGGIQVPFAETMMFDVGLGYNYVMTEEEDIEGSYNISYLAIKAGIGMKF